MNQVGAPWDVLLPSGGPNVGQITIAYIPRELLPALPGVEYEGVDTSDDGKVKSHADPLTGKVGEILTEQDSQEETQAEFSYDSYGRLIGSVDHTGASTETREIFNDWLTGNVSMVQDPGSSDMWLHNHAAGHTRITIAYVPEEWLPVFLIRGPHGQVKLAVDENGVAKDYYGYSSLGNRTAHENYQTPAYQPPYLDGDYSPIPAFEQYKSGGGTSQDMTQMIGAQDAPSESGAAGEGASGNPDGPFGGNSAFMYGPPPQPAASSTSSTSAMPAVETRIVRLAPIFALLSVNPPVTPIVYTTCVTPSSAEFLCLGLTYCAAARSTRLPLSCRATIATFH